MKRTRTVREPCVIWPAQGGSPEKHIIHGTAGRAQRNADLTAVWGTVYHVHERQVPTLYGWLRRWFS